MMMDQAMFCEWNECESEDCPRKHEMPQDVKNLGGGRKTPGGGVVSRTEESTPTVNGVQR